MKYWKLLNPDGTINTVESCSNDHKVPNGIEIEKVEFDSFIKSLPQPIPITSIYIVKEIEALKQRVQKLEEKGVNHV